MKKVFFAVVIGAMIVLPVAASAEIGPVIAGGAGFNLAARDAQGENEHVALFFDVGGRVNPWATIGGRCALEGWGSSMLKMSVWGKADMGAVSGGSIVPFLRLGVGYKTMDAKGVGPDEWNLQIPFGIGFQAVSSTHLSLFAEAEGVFDPDTEKVAAGFLRIGVGFEP